MYLLKYDNGLHRRSRQKVLQFLKPFNHIYLAFFFYIKGLCKTSLHCILLKKKHIKIIIITNRITQLHSITKNNKLFLQKFKSKQF